MRKHNVESCYGCMLRHHAAAAAALSLVCSCSCTAALPTVAVSCYKEHNAVLWQLQKYTVMMFM
jgi:hypothetical protein